MDCLAMCFKLLLYNRVFSPGPPLVLFTQGDSKSRGRKVHPCYHDALVSLESRHPLYSPIPLLLVETISAS